MDTKELKQPNTIARVQPPKLAQARSLSPRARLLEAGRVRNNAQPGSLPKTARLLRRRRRTRGSALSEMGPALFFILFFGIFLTIDLIALGFNYCACLTLNDVQLREASKLPAAIAQHPQGPVVFSIPEHWRNTTMGGLANVHDINTTVAYQRLKGNVFVTVTTNVQVRPPLTLPFFPGVPGLGAPVAFNISNSRLTEN